MAETAEDGARRMRDYIGEIVARYADGCAANPDREAGRVAAVVAQSIGRLIAEIPPGAVLIDAQAKRLAKAEG